LIEVCRRERIDLVLPLIDPDIPFLASHVEAIEQAGAVVGCVGVSAARVCADKWLTREFFDRIGIRTPESWLPTECPRDPDSFPLFIKPRRGSASRHAFRADTPAELDFFSGYIEDPLVQRCVSGPEITTDVICDRDGGVLAAVSRQRLAVRGGEVSKGVTVQMSEIQSACLKIARELPARGPITVQCMLDGPTALFTEINARVGGGIPLAIAAGVDVPSLIIQGLLEPPAVRVDPQPYEVGVFMTRYDDSFFLAPHERTALESRRIRFG
jgi:carbamoyl-phosphate synthase large subunit